MKFSFHPEADTEFFKSIEYYEQCELGLGYDSSVEVFSAIQTILKYPTAWSLIEDDIRRFLINSFTFGILYSIEEDEIYILAVMNLRRDPDYWKDRK
jgi:hypothetical protein